jgi:hypothetical protein
MKKLLTAVLAASALAVATPAFAQDYYYNDSVGIIPTQGSFDQQYRYILDRIQQGISDGAYTGQQARQYYRELRGIEAQAQWQENRGYYDPRDIQVQLVNLNERISAADERSRELSGGYDYWRGGPY